MARLDVPGYITVIDVIRERAGGSAALADHRLTLTVGEAARDRWYEKHGELPRKALRPKTHGVGSHCLAVYPPTFRPEIEQIVDEAGL